MYKINPSIKKQDSKHQSHEKHLNFQKQNNTNNIIYEDLSKMHLLPPNCPMTPKTYTDFFSHSQQEHQEHHSKYIGISPYKLEKVKHPREGYKHTIEYNDFYNDWNKDVLQYTSSNNKFIKNNNKVQEHIINDERDVNIKLYKETKPHNHFAKPMAINGSNKIVDLFDNCMNKKTFEYKRYSTISPHNKQWIDNPIFTGDISKETEHLKNNYMNNIDKDNMNIYSSVFEDMYYLTTDIHNKHEYEYESSDIVYKVEKKLKNTDINNLQNDNIKKSRDENIHKLDEKLHNRSNLRSEFIKPRHKSNNSTIRAENINYLGTKLDNQLNNSNNLLSKELKQYKSNDNN